MYYLYVLQLSLKPYFVLVAPSGIALEEKGLIPEETEEYFECSSSSSSNPPSTITWMIDNEDVTDEADQTITQGDNNGHDVHSKLTFTVNRDMNGQQLTCQLIYNNDEQYGHTNPLNISCEYIRVHSRILGLSFTALLSCPPTNIMTYKRSIPIHRLFRLSNI